MPHRTKILSKKDPVIIKPPTNVSFFTKHTVFVMQGSMMQVHLRMLASTVKLETVHLVMIAPINAICSTMDLLIGNGLLG